MTCILNLFQVEEEVEPDLETVCVTRCPGQDFCEVIVNKCSPISYSFKVQNCSESVYNAMRNSMQTRTTYYFTSEYGIVYTGKITSLKKKFITSNIFFVEGVLKDGVS